MEQDELVDLYDPDGELGIYQEVVDFEDLLRSLPYPPKFINDIDNGTPEGREELNQYLYTKYEKDYLSNTPCCVCKRIEGGDREGDFCTNCNSYVVPPTERPIVPDVWIRAPDGVKALINPLFWNILSKSFTSSGCNLIEYLCNPGYNGHEKNKYLIKLKEYNFPRGLNAFFDNFDAIMDVLVTGKLYKGAAKARAHLKQLIDENRQKIFTRYLPIPNKITFVVESSSVGSFHDSSNIDALDAVRTICSLSSSLTPPTQKVKENRTLKAISQLSNYYVEQYNNTFSKKEGLFRKQIYGTRMPFAYRSVISSLSVRHLYNEVHLPWGLGVSLFRIHLGNKLLRRGYTPNEATGFINKHVKLYNPLMDELLQELIKESPFVGLPTILQRNPTLARLSAQSLMVTKIKTDPGDNTTSLSVLVLKGPNADQFVVNTWRFTKVSEYVKKSVLRYTCF